MDNCRKRIQILVLFTFGANLLLLEWYYYNNQHDYEISSAAFLWYSSKGFSDDFGIQRNLNRDTLVQNLSSSNNSGKNLLNSSNYSNMKKCIKQVLYWGGPRMLLPDGEYFCPDVHCTAKLKSAKSYGALNTSHVVIFHHTGNWNIKESLRHRPEGQFWIYMSRESPPHSAHGRVPNVFNWTMTYRHDSDFPISYGIYKDYDNRTKEKNLMAKKNKNWAKNKTKLVAWISSNCNGPSWPRVKFVKELSKKMSIDMFGRCGDKSCPGTECYERIRSYKFYLAFENSRCTDYITEKMWRNAFEFDAVPVVYGTTKQNYEKLAPPNSFIHVSDFSNMTSLANYLKLLDLNDSLYNNFLRWKDYSYIDQRREDAVITEETLCSITKKLCNDDEIRKSEREAKSPIIADLQNMWFDTCNDSPPMPLPV